MCLSLINSSSTTGKMVDEIDWRKMVDEIDWRIKLNDGVKSLITMNIVGSISSVSNVGIHLHT